jgi:hypothetical protein
MKRMTNPQRRFTRVLLAGLVMLITAGCSQDDQTCTPQLPAQPAAPTGLTQLTFGGATLRAWPYTGATLDGTPQDPINLVFVGRATPIEIRAALVSLDGDRTGAGFPPVAPFDGVWSEANGDVQAAYAGSEGWTANVIQLQLGGYGPLRVHLRLFGTGQAWGGSGAWTLGSAHFEVVIPGTADHQVLNWELAEQVVAADLVRSGLLDPLNSTALTGVISDAPGFREIPAVIYNGLPPELRALIDGPTEDVTDPVPIGTDGQATILNLKDAAPIVPGAFTETLSMQYDQMVPRPFCSTGAYDYVYVSGPIEFRKTTIVEPDGRYRYESSYWGQITVTPFDVTVDPPVPSGTPFTAVVSDTQVGRLEEGQVTVTVQTKRVATHEDGIEYLQLDLDLTTQGDKTFRTETSCLTPGVGQ